MRLLLFLVFLAHELRKESVNATQRKRGPTFVIEPPSQVDFWNSTGTEIQCSASGQPQPSVEWQLADGSAVHDVRSMRYVRSNGSLSFPPFREYRSDVHSATYRCVATNAVGTIASRDVHVRAVLKVQPWSVNVYTEYVMAGGNAAVLRCQLPAFARDFVEVTSWIEETAGTTLRLATVVGSRYIVLPEGDLYVRSVDKSLTHRIFRCESRDRLTGETLKASQPGRLIVTDAPESPNVPRIVYTRARHLVRSGHSAFLSCAAHGSPAPSYRWYNDHNVPVVLNDRVVQLDGVLNIRQVNLQDSGRYTCVANNTVGEDRTTTELVVTESLQVHVDPPRLRVELGDAVTVRCSVTGHPISEIKWTHNTKQLTIGDALSSTSYEKTLHIRKVNKNDRGMYQCFARNDHESAQASFELTLSEDLPDFQSTFRSDIVTEGQRLSLKCAASGNPLPQVTWSVDGQPVPETHRVRFGDYVTQAGVVVSYLNISQIQVVDGGRYTCQANNGVGVAHHSASINVPGGPVARPVRNITVVAGDTVWLPCPISGYPLESITWQRSGNRLPHNHRQRVFDNGTLEIQHVDRASQDDGPYTCIVRGGALKKTVQNTHHLIIKVKPTIEVFSFPSFLREGQRSSVTCTVSSGDSPVNVTWYKDDKIVESSQSNGILMNNVADYSSTLVFTSLRVDHRGNYTCVASNSAGTVSHSSTMVIHVPPQWVIEPRDSSVVKGHDVVIDCAADGFPEPRIRWTKAEGGESARDFKPVVSSSHIQVFENGSLAVHAATEADQAYYLCQATNNVGQGLSKVIKLVVHIAAHFKTKFMTETARSGQRTKLNCEAHGDKPITVMWQKEKQILDPKSDPRYELVETVVAETGSVVSEILIRQTERKDSGLFTCVATNQHGRDETNVQLVVQEPPDAPKDLTVLEVTSRTIKIDWSEPFNGNNLITQYAIQYREQQGKWHGKFLNISVSVIKETGAVIRNLKPAQTYAVRVFAENKIGLSQPSNELTAITSEEAPGGPPIKIGAQPLSSQSIKISWKPPSHDLQHGVIKGYYVGYKPSNSKESYKYKTLDGTVTGFLSECVLVDLKRSTQYGIIVQAYNAKGAGPPSDVLLVKTLDNDPPTAPKIWVDGKTASSVTLKWTPKQDKSNYPTGYHIRYKQAATSSWSEIHLQGDHNSHTISNLQCGTAYNIAIRAYSKSGNGEWGEVTTVKTEGGAPVAPDTQSVLRHNSTDAMLHLTAWHNGGCPITHFMIRYKKQRAHTWTNLQTQFEGPDAKKIIELTKLSPGAWYTLEVTAYNAAGATEAQYSFATMLLHRDYQNPRSEVQLRESASVDHEASLVIPVTTSVLVLLIVIALLFVTCLALRRKRSSDSLQSDGSLYGGIRKGVLHDGMQLSDLEKPQANGGLKGSAGNGGMLYYPASPYATTQLTSRGPEKGSFVSRMPSEEPLYATVKRTPRPPRQDGHIYQCPTLTRQNGSVT